ncbi:hypothetical protein ZIOFF_068813 [Zingiber officinale]|uniref:Uncharacterized protein n=1 Tax=Zingiber officinale TaxID=94328 RepID=A0A8J5CAZ3_ZINOF|nr:hypothetical protein ZIOFF_068813 [Zingiber officinale]
MDRHCEDLNIQAKELAPYDPDWFYIRAASMARKMHLRQGIGVGGFHKMYGGHRMNGSRPPHFCKSSAAIARNILLLFF